MSFFLRSGIGAQVRGFKNSGLYDVDVIATSDIDKDAIVSYAAIHCGLTPELIGSYEYPSADEMISYLKQRNIGYVFEKNKPYDWKKKRNSADLKKYYLACVLSKNMGDISKIEELPYADVLTYSFPCQSISVAGKMEGLQKGKTRSGLLYEVQRLLDNAVERERERERESLPKYLLLENVKALCSKQFKPQFDEWCDYLNNIGYNTYWKVLNACECGIPQHRERVFAISIRKDIDTGCFTFPKPFDTGIRLKNVIDEVVDDKFYINTPASQTALQEMADNGTLEREEKIWNENNGTYQNYGIISRAPNTTVFPLNHTGGYSRTIKAQYSNSSIQNFQSHSTFGATGVLKHEQNHNNDF